MHSSKYLSSDIDRDDISFLRRMFLLPDVEAVGPKYYTVNRYNSKSTILVNENTDNHFCISCSFLFQSCYALHNFRNNISKLMLRLDQY